MMNPSAPIGTILLAKEYLHSASKVLAPARTEAEAMRQRLSVPAYYLVGHSIELALKAFLLGRGMAEAELRSQKKGYSHDIGGLLKEARRRRLGMCVKLSAHEQAVIATLGVHYASKELEYRITGAKRLPYYEEAFAVAEKLCLGIEPYCVKKLRGRG